MRAGRATGVPPSVLTLLLAIALLGGCAAPSDEPPASAPADARAAVVETKVIEDDVFVSAGTAGTAAVIHVIDLLQSRPRNLTGVTVEIVLSTPPPPTSKLRLELYARQEMLAVAAPEDDGAYVAQLAGEDWGGGKLVLLVAPDSANGSVEAQARLTIFVTTFQEGEFDRDLRARP